MKRNEGFVLIESAIFILIFGICSFIIFNTYESLKKYSAILSIKNKQENITKLLSSFLLENNRLPCAANPNSGVEQPGLYIGTIPYKTLGIPKQMVKDENGNFMIYVVDEKFTVTTSINKDQLSLSISDGESFCEIKSSNIKLLDQNNIEDPIICFAIIPIKILHGKTLSVSAIPNNNLVKWVSKNLLLSVYCNTSCNPQKNF